MVQIKALNCPNCGASIADTSKACSHCGSRVVLSDDRQKFVLVGKICSKCGTDNKEQNRFCRSCGGKLFKICPNCLEEIELDDLHCPLCGIVQTINAIDSKDDWDSRVLCGDGRCIGVIGDDGRCKECGKTLEESKRM